MGSRSIRKRRHREDFTQYIEARSQWQGMAKNYKQFGFPNEVAFMKALAAHQQKQAQEHAHDENCQHEHPHEEELVVHEGDACGVKDHE